MVMRTMQAELLKLLEKHDSRTMLELMQWILTEYSYVLCCCIFARRTYLFCPFDNNNIFNVYFLYLLTYCIIARDKNRGNFFLHPFDSCLDLSKARILMTLSNSNVTFYVRVLYK